LVAATARPTGGGLMPDVEAEIRQQFEEWFEQEGIIA